MTRTLRVSVGTTDLVKSSFGEGEAGLRRTLGITDDRSRSEVRMGGSLAVSALKCLWFRKGSV